MGIIRWKKKKLNFLYRKRFNELQVSNSELRVPLQTHLCFLLQGILWPPDHLQTTLHLMSKHKNSPDFYFFLPIKCSILSPFFNERTVKIWGRGRLNDIFTKTSLCRKVLKEEIYVKEFCPEHVPFTYQKVFNMVAMTNIIGYNTIVTARGYCTAYELWTILKDGFCLKMLNSSSMDKG